MNVDQIKANKTRKKRNRLIFRTSVIVILIAAVAYALISNLTEDTIKIEVGSQAHNFTLEQINENNALETVELKDLEGEGVMLNFWATYCKPCEAEMPYMEKMYAKYKDKGIEIVGVNLDLTELVVHRFIDRYDLTFPIPQDESGQIRELYGIGPIPSTFFINSDGEVVEIVEGALSLDSIEGYLKEIQPE